MITEARIVYVDTSRNCCDAISIYGNSFFEDISYLDSGMRQSGQKLDPEYGDVVILDIGEDGQVILKKHYNPRSMNSDGLVQYSTGLGRNPNLNSSLPGDQTFAGPDGAWLSLLRGSALSAGAGPLAQTFYSGIEGLIRTVCMNLESMGSGYKVYSINENGKVTTRLGFTGQDQYVSSGINNNDGSLFENFEYVIDITESGFCFFVGSINEKTGKRVNNIVVSLAPAGDIHIEVGLNTIVDLYSDGTYSYKVFDDDKVMLYNKTISLRSDKKSVQVKEMIEGDYLRSINGNYHELISGNKEETSANHITKSNILDQTQTLHKSSSSVVTKDLASVPISGVKST